MFVYEVPKQRKYPLKQKPLITRHIKDLVDETNKRFGLNFELDIHFNTLDYYLEVYMVDYSYPSSDYLPPQFVFRIVKNKKSVYLHSLKFPVSLRNKGLGRYLVDWLKDFCQKCGYNYIVLSSKEHAIGFWSKMNFKDRGQE